MNKLVIVGNGFDLAHGLPTSYCHFMDDFWKNLSENYKKESIKELVFINKNLNSLFTYNEINGFNSFIESLSAYCEKGGYKYDSLKYIATGHHKVNGEILIFNFKSNFFKEINIHNSINNWVDIENLYYDKLKEITKATGDFKEKKERALKLNLEFEQVKKLFEEYLNTKIND